MKRQHLCAREIYLIFFTRALLNEPTFTFRARYEGVADCSKHSVLLVLLMMMTLQYYVQHWSIPLFPATNAKCNAKRNQNTKLLICTAYAFDTYNLYTKHKLKMKMGKICENGELRLSL